MVNIKVKNNIKFYRELYGLTQSDLAKYIGVSVNTISSIENCSSYPSVNIAFMLCVGFGVQFEDLFYYDDRKDSFFHVMKHVD